MAMYVHSHLLSSFGLPIIPFCLCALLPFCPFAFCFPIFALALFFRVFRRTMRKKAKKNPCKVGAYGPRLGTQLAFHTPPSPPRDTNEGSWYSVSIPTWFFVHDTFGRTGRNGDCLKKKGDEWQCACSDAIFFKNFYARQPKKLRRKSEILHSKFMHQVDSGFGDISVALDIPPIGRRACALAECHFVRLVLRSPGVPVAKELLESLNAVYAVYECPGERNDR
jgi:hypothetical protein